MTGKRQFGTIRKLPSRRWQARYRDGSGQLVTAPSTFVTKTDAARFLAVVEADLARGLYIDPRAGRITLEEWSEIWLQRPGKRAASIARDRQGIAMFLPVLGRTFLVALTPGLVQSAVDARAKVAAPATVARDFSALRAVLNAAVEAELVPRSPARNIALPRVVRTDRSGLTPDQLAHLLEEVPDHYRVLVMVAAVLGLRWGEVIGLRVRDVDFMRRTVTVAQVIEELAGRLSVVPEAKTRSSLRTLATPQFVLEEIARHLSQHRSEVVGTQLDSESLIFVGPRGGLLRRRFGERILRPAVMRAGLPTQLTFHALRHSAVTAMANAGVPYNVTQARAGHATARMTMELYSHLTSEADRDAAYALERHYRDVFGPESGTDVARAALKGE